MKNNINIFIMISVIVLGCGQYIFTAEEEAAQKQDEASRLEEIFLKKLPHFRDLYYGILFPLLNMENQLDKLFFKETNYVGFDYDKIKGLILDINSILETENELFLKRKKLSLIGLDLAAFKSDVVNLMSREGRQALENITWVVKDVSSRLVKFLDRLGEYVGELNYYNAEHKSIDYFFVTVKVIEKMNRFVSLLKTLKDLFRKKNVKLTDDSIAMYREMVFPNLKKHLYNVYDVKKGKEEGKIEVNYLDDGDMNEAIINDPLKYIAIDLGTEGRVARARRSLQERYKAWGRYGTFVR